MQISHGTSMVDLLFYKFEPYVKAKEEKGFQSTKVVVQQSSKRIVPSSSALKEAAIGSANLSDARVAYKVSPIYNKDDKEQKMGMFVLDREISQ